MPELTIDGHCVFVDKVTWNEKYFDMRMIMKCFCMETEIKFIEGKFDSGDVILFDCNKLPIGKVVPFIPFFIRSLTSLLEVRTVTRSPAALDSILICKKKKR